MRRSGFLGRKRLFPTSFDGDVYMQCAPESAGAAKQQHEGHAYCVHAGRLAQGKQSGIDEVDA